MQQIKIVNREYVSAEKTGIGYGHYEFYQDFEKRVNGILAEGWTILSVIPETDGESSVTHTDPLFILTKTVESENTKGAE